MKYLSAVFAALSFFAWYILALAAVTQASAGSAPSWFEHVDLMSATIWALMIVVVWFTLRTLRKIDMNQTTLFNKIDSVCKDFYNLQGEHNARKDRCHQ